MSIVSTSCLIIGSGPAAYTAGIYLGRAERRPIIAGGHVHGGQLMLTTEVENFPGFVTVQGQKLMQDMHDQALACGAQFCSDYIDKVDLSCRPFKAWSSETCFSAQALIFAMGAQTRWLGLESETKFRGYGVSSCATCDGNFFRNKDVMVVGGGNSAIEEALYLSHLARHVTVVHRGHKLRAEETLQRRLREKSNVAFLWGHRVVDIMGQDQPKKVTHVRLLDLETDQNHVKQIDGIFIAIGHIPNTTLLKDHDDHLLDGEGYMIKQPDRSMCSIEGVFVAGDVCDKTYRQAVTAAAQGCMAAIDAGKFLETQETSSSTPPL